MSRSSESSDGHGDDLDGLIHRADLDGLVRLVDAHCASGDWAGLLRLRNAARFAVTTGRQLWPAATLAEYRLALRAPAEWAVQVLDEDSGRFTIGPLTEVVAVHHTFESVAAALTTGVGTAGGPRLGFVAYERSLRGERIDPKTLDRLGVPDVLDIPLQLQQWEPAYCLAEYTDDGVTADPPTRPVVRSRPPRVPLVPPVSLHDPPRDDSNSDFVVEPPRDDSTRPSAPPVNRHVEVPEAQHPAAGPPTSNRHVEDREGVETVDDPTVGLAVRQLFDGWTASSDGRVDVTCVEGSAERAVAALGALRASLTPIDSADAMTWLAWAGSIGGAHGRRRGAAVGRFGAWWLIAALGDALDDWPLPADEMGALVRELRWFWWDAGEPALGWELQLAVEDSESGYAWAISAHDAA